MGYLREVDASLSFQSFATFREHFGFVSKQWGAQTDLLDFAVRLGSQGTSISSEDVGRLLGAGLSDEAVLEAVLVAAWANFCSTLSTGIGTEPDFALPGLPASPADSQSSTHECWGPYLKTVPLRPAEFAPFAILVDHFGFVPSLFRSQGLRPDALAAEVSALQAILLTGSALKRAQKEGILLAASGANQNTYCVVVFAEVSGALGTPVEDSYQTAMDHRQVALVESEHALLDFAIKLILEPAGFTQQDVDLLRTQGFNDEQVLDAVAVTALTRFLNTVQWGVGAVPDFAPRQSFRRAGNNPHLSSTESRRTQREEISDPDAGLVEKAKSGDLDAFQALVERHSKRVYRTLLGLLGDADQARDAMQDTFLKAFQHLGGFESRSKFCTWLVTIASNTGLQLLRERRPIESLDSSDSESDEAFRPRQIRAWTENPEQMYAQTERRALVERAVLALPAKYRVVVLLRDIEQLPAEEAAAALGLGVPALKSRLLRGRLMLREALAPHFMKNPKGVSA